VAVGGRVMEGGPRLDGKSAVVVGAAQGIGRAIALCFAGAGAHVLCADIDEVGATATAAQAERSGGKAAAARIDVTKAADAQALAARAVEVFGGLDVLLFGAATHDASATVPELEESVWERVLRVNLTGAYLVCKACLPVMIRGGGGSIILIASQLGRVASPGRAAYCTTKGGLIQLARVMAADHAAQGVRVNTLSPGAVETDRLVRRWGDMGKAREVMAPKHLLGRLGQPDEIAGAALFLASSASSFMTGADLLVDGGYTAV
jgi:NAD(P)-dependent dehydrogenase (short-subunit alcohol dehydrogenase family)